MSLESLETEYQIYFLDVILIVHYLCRHCRPTRRISFPGCCPPADLTACIWSIVDKKIGADTVHNTCLVSSSHYHSSYHLLLPLSWHIWFGYSLLFYLYRSLDTQVCVPCFFCSGSVQFNLLVWLYLFSKSSIYSYLLFIYPPYYLYRYAYIAWYNIFGDSASVLLDYWNITNFYRGTPSFWQEKPSQHI